MPGVAYLEMARAAVSEAVGADVMYKLGNLYLSHVVWIRPLVCNPEHPVTLHITLSPADENGTILFVISRDNTNYGATSNEQAQDAVPKTPQEQESAEFIYYQGIAQWQAEHNVGSTASQSLDLAAVQARCQHQIFT